MEHRRFDDLTRSVAGHGSRRGLLRGLLGATVAAAFGRSARSASAHHGRSGPGDPCRQDSDCVAADTALVCAYNGFDYDGPLTCCGYDRCSTDETCCGQLVCGSQGYCVDPAPPACSGYGCVCSDDGQCDQGLVCCFGTSGSGTCLPLYTCTGTGAPGDDCPAYCLPGPTQCPSCVSGYCGADGVCG